MKLLSIPLIYKDKDGTIKTDLKTNGHWLYMTVRGIEFNGQDFESFESKESSNDLTNFTMEFSFPLTIVLNKKETLSELKCKVVTQETKSTKIDVKLIGNFSAIELKNEEEFEYILLRLQKKLSSNHTIKSCLSCRYSNYHPVGNGIFGGIYCFVQEKEKVLKITDKSELMELWTAERVASGLIFNVQETFLCDKHEFVQEDDWVYKSWDLEIVIDNKLQVEIKKFKEWETSCTNAKSYEDGYPNWDTIYSVVENVPNDLRLYLSSIDSILYFLGKDNESEILMGILEEKSVLGYLIAKEGMGYVDVNTRWQVAVLLTNFKDTELLIKMIETDKEEYVRRRALLGLRTLDTKSAEVFAIKYLKSSYEYERMVALDTLDFMASSYLAEALNMLKSDSSFVVKDKMKNMKKILKPMA